MKIGFVGLGRMGAGMARRLLERGFELAIPLRSPERSAPLIAQGATGAADLTTLCRDRDVIITMLPSDAALEAVALDAAGLVASMRTGAIHLVSGTHSVASIERLLAAHTARGQILVSCTVLGRPERAAQGKLGLVPAGPAAAVARLTPLMQALGDTIFHAGEDPLQAVAIKIANNFVLGCAIEAIGEGMALVRRYGVDPHLFHQVLSQGLFSCIAYQAYGDVIAKQDWGRVGATASIGLKDARLALDAAEHAAVPLPSARIWHDHLLAACARGEQDLDWSVMAREQFRESGLE